jgi:hypothetical protein
MPDSSPSPSRSRRRRVLSTAAAVVGLALVAFLAAAVIPTPSHRPAAQQTGVVSVAHGSDASEPVRVHKVFGSRVSAKRYGTQVAERENGVGSGGQYVSDLTPIAWRRVLGPIARYKRYAEAWAGRLGR